MYDERDSMEATHAESLPQVKSPLLKGVQEKIISYHDQHLRVTPISDHIAQSFESAAIQMKSIKGKEMVARLAPKIKDIAKGIEVGAATVDIVGGVIATGLGVKHGLEAVSDYKSIRTMRDQAKIDGAHSSVIQGYTGVGPEKKVLFGAVDAGTAGIFLGVRPISRGVDAVSGPLEKRILRTMDAILLRQEQKQPVRQVFVGTGKA
jgi:hypothetical protein